MKPLTCRISAGAPLRAKDFPALREFLAGYLHQDFTAEHGTPEAAARAFRAVAAETQSNTVAAELSRFLDVTHAQPFELTRELFTEILGSAWRPREAAALRHLLSALRGE